MLLPSLVCAGLATWQLDRMNTKVRGCTTCVADTLQANCAASWIIRAARAWRDDVAHTPRRAPCAELLLAAFVR